MAPKQFFKKYRGIIVVTFLFVAFLGYKMIFSSRLSVGYERIPDASEILDERINVLSGITFAKDGIPTGWSNLSAYYSTQKYHKESSVLGFNGIQVTKDYQTPNLSNVNYFHYPIVAIKEVNLPEAGIRQISFVQPFFDHSPFAGLLYMQSVKDKSSIEKLTPAEYRFVPTNVLFWINAILLFLVAFVLTKRLLPGISAFLIYTTAPSFVLSSRLSMLENTVIPFSLATLLFLLLYKRFVKAKGNQSLIFLLLASVCTGLSIATKESGIAVLLMSIIILVQYKVTKKTFALFLIPALLIGVAIYAYFFAVSPTLFWNIFGNQAGRGFFGPLNFIYSIAQLQFHNFPLDGYWVFGFMSIGFLTQGKENRSEIIAGFVATLITYLFFAGLNYPWYSLPFIPFLVLGSAIFIDDLVRKPEILRALIFFVLPVSSSFYWGYVVKHDGSSILMLYRVILGAIVFVFLLSRFKIKNKQMQFIFPILILAIGVISVLWNIQSISFIIEHWGKLPNLFSVL